MNCLDRFLVFPSSLVRNCNAENLSSNKANLRVETSEIRIGLVCFNSDLAERQGTTR